MSELLRALKCSETWMTDSETPCHPSEESPFCAPELGPERVSQIRHQAGLALRCLSLGVRPRLGVLSIPQVVDSRAGMRVTQGVSCPVAVSVTAIGTLSCPTPA